MNLFRSLCLFILVFLSGTHVAYSQSRADMEMAEALNSGDLFLLKQQYPLLKDSVSMGMLNLLVEAKLCLGFNRLESAAVAMDSLLQSYQEELGSQAIIDMGAARAMNLLNMGFYAAAGKAGEDLVNLLKDALPFESLYSLIFIERMGKALSQTPAPYLERPSSDIVIPMRSDSVGRGCHLYIPVEVNGITKNYIFDTGCSFGNFVSEKYAHEAGLEIIADSIPVSGMEIGFVKLAVADSLRVGEMVYHHPVFMVAPSDSEVDSLFTFDGVLGYHFIRDAKEVIIDNESKSFIFPARISSGESNMFFSSNTPHLRIMYDGQPFDMIFDTGNVKSDLGNKFAQLFPGSLSGLAEHEARRGGFGGVSEVVVVTLPEFHFTVSAVPVTLHDTEVLKTDGRSQLFSGSLGADFVLSFRRLAINYEHMFIQGVPFP